MGLEVNLRHLEKGPLRLKGELTPAELELEGVDELVQIKGNVRYELTVEKMEKSILAQGRLEMQLQCECARCLKSFQKPLELTDWTCHLLLEGEEKTPIINDSVDLTPLIREDILLEFPQHPLCQPDCDGLPGKLPGKANESISGTRAASSSWAELNKLKF